MPLKWNYSLKAVYPTQNSENMLVHNARNSSNSEYIKAEMEVRAIHFRLN